MADPNPFDTSIMPTSNKQRDTLLAEAKKQINILSKIPKGKRGHGFSDQLQNIKAYRKELATMVFEVPDGSSEGNSVQGDGSKSPLTGKDGMPESNVASVPLVTDCQIALTTEGEGELQIDPRLLLTSDQKGDIVRQSISPVDLLPLISSVAVLPGVKSQTELLDHLPTVFAALNVLQAHVSDTCSNSAATPSEIAWPHFNPENFTPASIVAIAEWLARSEHLRGLAIALRSSACHGQPAQIPTAPQHTEQPNKSKQASKWKVSTLAEGIACNPQGLAHELETVRPDLRFEDRAGVTIKLTSEVRQQARNQSDAHPELVEKGLIMAAMVFLNRQGNARCLRHLESRGKNLTTERNGPNQLSCGCNTEDAILELFLTKVAAQLPQYQEELEKLPESAGVSEGKFKNQDYSFSAANRVTLRYALEDLLGLHMKELLCPEPERTIKMTYALFNKFGEVVPKESPEYKALKNHVDSVFE